MADMHRLQPGQIHLGHPLPWNVFDNAGHLLLRKGFIVEQHDQVERLIERGIYVKTEEFREAIHTPVVERYDPMLLWESIQAHLAYILEAMPQDGSLQPGIERIARQVMTLTERSPDLILAAVMLMDHRNYPVAHSTHTAFVADLVARRAGWAEPARLSVCCAALTMNLAMLRLQLTLCAQRETLTPEQRRAINEHPMESARLLIMAGVNDDEWLRAVLEHHECPSGTGYPRKVTNPGEPGLLLHTADVFAAKVSPRSHRKPMMASEATKEVFTKLGLSGLNPFPALLVKVVGIHPPGAIVRLVNGEMGVVKQRGPSPKTPLVRVLVSSKGLPVLSPVERETWSNQGFAIASVMSRDKALIGLNFEQIWGLQAASV